MTAAPAAPAGWLHRALGTAAWLHGGRVIAYGRVLLVVELIAFVIVIFGTHGAFGPLERPASTDFNSFYAAGALADAGTPALAYDRDAHYAAEQAAAEPGIVYNFFFYPPPMLLLCAPLAHLPYLVAFVVFEGAAILLFVAIARRILQERGGAWLAPLLASPAGFWALGLGQNSFLSASLFAGGLLLLDRRPWLAGMLFGLLCYKPHFGLLIPLALLAGRHWRAVGGAAVSVALAVGLSVLLFGVQTWAAFLESFSHSPDVYQSGRITLAGMVSVFGSVLILGFTPPVAYAVQGVVSVAVAVCVVWVWARRMPIELRAGALVAGTFLAVPLALVYDLTIVFAGWLFLVRAGRRGGFLAWEKVLLTLAFLVPMASRSIAVQLFIPFGLLGSAIPFALVLRRALRHGSAPAGA